MLARSPADLLAGAAHLAGFVLTIAYHVPRNDALATLSPEDSASAVHWETYLREWTRGNAVRACCTGWRRVWRWLRQ